MCSNLAPLRERTLLPEMPLLPASPRTAPAGAATGELCMIPLFPLRHVPGQAHVDWPGGTPAAASNRRHGPPEPGGCCARPAASLCTWLHYASSCMGTGGAVVSASLAALTESPRRPVVRSSRSRTSQGRDLIGAAAVDRQEVSALSAEGGRPDATGGSGSGGIRSFESAPPGSAPPLGFRSTGSFALSIRRRSV